MGDGIELCTRAMNHRVCLLICGTLFLSAALAIPVQDEAQKDSVINIFETAVTENVQEARSTCASKLKFNSATQSGNTHGHSSAYGAKSAIDGNSGTRNGIEGSWTGDLGREHTLKSLTVEWEACQCAKADSVLVDVSTDGRSWKRFASFGGWHQWGGRKQRSVSGSGQARYVRLTGTGNMSNRWMSFFEVTATGCPGTTMITLAPQVANEVPPDEVSAGGKKFVLSGVEGCPCPDGHTHRTPTKKSQQACAQHCASTSSCDVFYWNDLTTDCWLSQSVFVVHADSFCPGKQGSFCYTFMHFPA